MRSNSMLSAMSVQSNLWKIIGSMLFLIEQTMFVS